MVRPLPPTMANLCLGLFALLVQAQGNTLEALWKHPIVGSGATSGEQYIARRHRRIDAALVTQRAKGGAVNSKQQPTCSHWVVTTTINAASPNLQSLAGMPGWCKCFVLDRKSPPNFSLTGPGVVILTVADQEKLTWAVAGRIPWNHFGRKNLGFVYAALHGAEVIYDTDDDNFILDGDEKYLPRSLSAPEGWSMQWPSTGAPVFNPYPFWGVNAWPRGFPLTMINNDTTKSGARFQTAGAPEVPLRVCALQTLANADPDVDAIYRLTGTLPLYFTPRKAWLQLPQGMYAPFNAQATIFSRSVAAALALPVTVHGRVSDIWRSYIMQRAMWDLGCGLAFSDPWVTQYRNAHKYLKDFQSELDLYLKTEGLVEVLNGMKFPDWQFASKDAELAGRVLGIYICLYEHALLEVDDVWMVQAFLTDLGLMGQNEVAFALRVNDLTQPVAAAAAQSVQHALQPAAATNQRAAVCVTGVFRAGPFTWPWYERHVLVQLGMPYDVYVITPKLDAFPDVTDYLYFVHPYKVVYPTYERVSKLLSMHGWEKTDFTGQHTPSKWLHQMVDLYACRDAVKASGVPYSHVVRLRADSVLVDPIPLPPHRLGPKDVVTPDNEEHDGVNDRFAYGTWDGMMAYLSVMDSVPSYLENGPIKNETSSRWGVGWWFSRKGRQPYFNAEGGLKRHLQLNGVVVHRRPLQLCRFRNYTAGRFVCNGWDQRYEQCKDVCRELRADVEPYA